MKARLIAAGRRAASSGSREQPPTVLIGTIIVVVIALTALLLVLFRGPERTSNSSEKKTRSTGIDAAPTEAKYEVSPNTGLAPMKIAFGPLEAPFFEMSRSPLLPLFITEEFRLDSSLKQQLLSLFQHAPQLALNADLLAANRYVVHFSAEVTRGLSNGSMELMRSSEGFYAIAVRADGKRIVQPALIGMGVSTVAIIGLFWQVGAIVFGQKFLSVINQQLTRISDVVDYIKLYLVLLCHKLYAQATT
jgi:hypothetical protein